MRISDWSSVVCSSDLIQGSTRKLNASTRPGRAGTTPGRRHARGAGPGLRKTPRMHAPSTRKTLLALTLAAARSEEHTSDLQSLIRISYAVFCLKKKNTSTSSNALHTLHHRLR